MTEYARHAHRVQTAIATMMELDPTWALVQTKHLRTGIDCTKSDAGGLATLLIGKGAFTQEEYVDAITAAMEREADAYEKMLQALLSHRGIRTV